MKRRALLGAACAGAGLALAGCGPRVEAVTERTRRAPKLAYLPRTDLPPPSIPGTEDGFVPPAYFAYPRELVKSVERAPLRGGRVTAFGMNFLPPAPAVDRNVAQQAVNRALGGELVLNTASYTDYTAKFGTILASGEMPDVLFLHDTKIFPRQAEMLRYLCADLGPILEGKGILAYPNLAALPPYMWRNGLLNGTQFGVPNGQGGAWWLWMIADEAAVGHDMPTSAAAFRQRLKDVTGAGRWGMVADNAFPPAIPFAAMMWKAPKNWAERDGRLTKDIETDRYKAAVGYARDLFASGLIYPEFPVQAQAIDLFTTGKAGFYHVTVGTTRTIWERLAREHSAVSLAVITPPGHDGGAGSYHYGSGSYGKVVLRKAGEARLREVLGVLDFLAAPFGSRENHLIDYGVEGHDFTWANGTPQPIAAAKAELNVPYRYLMNGADVIYSAARSRDFAERFHRWTSDHAAIAISDPTIGLASRTYGARGSALEQMIRDQLRDIVVGRAPFASYNQLVRDWRSAGGDRVRDELEAALAASR